MKNRIYTTIVCAVFLAALLLALPGTGISAMVDDVENVIQSVTGRRTANYIEVSSGVKDALRLYEDVDFRYKDGTLSLTGMVDNEKEKEEIISRARSIPGVNTVKDNLVAQGTDDAAISAAIKTRIIGQKELDALDISVKTVKGTVTLKGKVEHIAQMLLAEQVANATDGVLKVQNELLIMRFPAPSALPRVM